MQLVTVSGSSYKTVLLVIYLGKKCHFDLPDPPSPGPWLSEMYLL